jgi:predicted flap endonuclease-1-like 5' DNA nuclease
MTTSISGIVNRYRPVATISGAFIMLGGADNPFRPSDRALVIQMTGADIDLSNTQSFGTIRNLGSTGCYEWVTVSEIDGARITLDRPLRGSFDPDNGRVQIVLVSAHKGDVVISDKIEAADWDGTIGGVIAIETDGAIDLLADVDASAQGFRGGKPSANGYIFSRLDYVCAADNEAGQKGEGIASLEDKLRPGRGAAANGGGGGNAHNAGGGGGGGGGSGGGGGYQLNGTTPMQNGGIGGLALAKEDRAFLGGGGGGGHQNDGVAEPGAAGGGIIFLSAAEIRGSAGRAVRANGGTPPTSRWDGASGGGGGGTIVLQAQVVSGGFGLEAHGGNGGAAYGGHGPGGGGGGGVIRSSLALPSTVTTSVARGLCGNSGTGYIQGAEEGKDGVVGTLPEEAVTTPGPQPGTGTPEGESHEKRITALEETLKKCCGECQDKLAALSKENTDLAERLVALVNLANSTETRLGDALTRLERSGDQLAVHEVKCEQEYEELMRRLSAHDADCGSCEEKLAAQNATIAALEQRITDLERQSQIKRPDDLTKIVGIGPEISKLLAKAGIQSFAQLAATEVSRIRRLLAAGERFALADPSSWPEQAKFAAEERWNELKDFQAKLRVGRSI